MRIVDNDTECSKARRLFDLIAEQKRMAKAVEELKKHFKDMLVDDNSLKVGEILIITSSRSRTDLDKAALAEALGPDVLREFERQKSYEIMEVKLA